MFTRRSVRYFLAFALFILATQPFALTSFKFGSSWAKTLADAWAVLSHLPVTPRDKATWRYVAARLDEAARGADPLDVVVLLRMVLGMRPDSGYLLTPISERAPAIDHTVSE